MSSSTKMSAASTASSGVAAALHHPKVERKLMEEKIAKVREVVKNISTNDIVLALHNFELDVARTIHAFCEGGSQSALGDWEKSGAAKKRNNKKKAKSSVAQPQSDVVDGHSTGKLTKGTFGTSSISSSISSATTFSTNNGFPSSNFNGTVAANATHHPPPPSSMLNGGGGGVDSMSSNGANLKQNGLPATEQQPFLMMNGTTPRVDSDQTMLPETFGRPTMAPIGSKEVFAAPVDPLPTSGSGDNEAHLERNKSLFEQEVVYAQENIQRCFKEVQEALRQREQHLLGELVDCRQAGLAYFASRAGILQKMSSTTTTSKAQQQQLMENFNEAKTEDLECALTGRFLFEQADLAGIVQSVGQFGRVIPVKMAPAQAMAKKVEPTNASASSTRPLPQNAGQMRRSNSPSSLVSSIDSGLGGQISPVNQEKAAVAQMDEGGGIVLKSDHISADQLAEIQRNILDSLKAKGIDPAMLAQINATSTLTAPRRRQPPAPRNGDGHNQKGGGSNGAQQQHSRQHQRGNGPNKGTGGGAGGGQGVQGGQQQQQAKKQANKTGGTGNAGTGAK